MRTLRSLIIVAGLVTLVLAISITNGVRIAAQTNPQLPPGLVAWWPADGDAQDIVGPNEGTLLNGTTFASGKFGQAFSFDGVDDVIDLGDNNIIGSGTAPFSVAMWMYPTRTPVGSYYFPIRLKQDTQFLIAFISSLQGDYVTAAFRGGSAWYIPINLDLLLNRWTHVTVNYNGGDKSSASSYEIYFDGVQLPFGTLDAGYVSWYCNDNVLGSDVSSGCDYNLHFFQGLMDEVQVYNHALSQSEIQTIIDYAGGVEPTPTPIPTPTPAPTFPQLPSGLISYWPAEGNANDVAGPYNGTLLNGATFGPGKAGQAFHFDGVDDVIDLGSSNNIIGSGNTPFSVAMWINPARIQTNGYYFTVRLRQDTQFLIAFIRPSWDTTRDYVTAAFRGYRAWYIPISHDMLLNRWTHVTVNYNGGDKSSASSFAIYFDGVQLPIGTLDAGGVGGSCNDNVIGSDCGSGSPFAGRMDEIQIYNHALSQSEVQTIIENTGGVEPTPTSTPTPSPAPSVTQTPTPTPSQGPTPTPISPGVWVSYGPDGGSITDLAVSPNYANDHTIFVVASEIIYKSVDGGVSWTQLNAGLRSIFIALSPNYSSDQTVFAGGAFKTFLRSSDGGQTWTQIDIGGDGNDIAFSPDYTNDHTVLVIGQGGIFRSSDRGINWTKISDGPVVEAGTGLAVSPDYPTSPTIYASAGGSLYKSTDNGVTWSLLTSSYCCMDFAMSPNFANDHTLLKAGPAHVFKSTDEGVTWTFSLSGSFFTIAFSPNYAVDGTIYAVGAGGAYKSVNRGGSWTALDYGQPGTLVYSVGVSPQYSSDNTVFVGTELGVFKSTDSGNTWVFATDGVNRVTGNGVYVSPTYESDQTIFDIGSAIYKSGDGGRNWQIISHGMGRVFTAMGISPDYANDKTVLVGSYCELGGNYRSLDGGQTWEPVNGLGCPQWTNSSIGAFSFSPSFASDRIVFAASFNGIHKSTDGGANWLHMSNGIPVPSVNTFQVAVSSDYAQDQTVFALAGPTYPGWNVNSLYRSTDGGQNWSLVEGLSNLRPLIAVSPNYSNDRTVIVAKVNSVYRSTDGGDTWTILTNQLYDTSSIKFSPAYLTDHSIYALTAGGGIYVSRDGGVSWIPIQGNRPGGVTFSVGIRGDVADIFVGTYGQSVWQTTLAQPIPTPTVTPTPTPTPSFNTPAGSGIVVQPIDETTGGTPVMVTYTNVSQSGNTSLVTSPTGQPPPAGFRLGMPPTYYELQTTAVFDQAEVCIDYSGTSLDTNNPRENNLKIFHLENNAWADVTTSLDTNSNVICALVTSFSPFAVFESFQPPTVDAGGPYGVDEGNSIQVSATGIDPENGPLTYAWDLDDNGTFETPGQSVAFSSAGLDGPSSHTVTVQVTDSGGLTATAQATANVLNVPPIVSAITASMDPMQVNTAINATATFIDLGVLDTHTAVWDWGDGNISLGTVIETNGSGSATGSHNYIAAGVYTVKVTVTDDDGGSGQSVFQFIVAYDPSAGFVTGGGWIDSPAGAYALDPWLTGRANFGFVSKYQKGATVPVGQTEFQFHLADLNFHSTSYQWLVISGPKAQYKGSGTINGSGDYGFMLTAIDGQVSGGGGVDKFRIKIWDKDTGNVVYDNQMGAGDTVVPTTAVTGGSIVIHN